ncbi:MAG: hypothetical protein ACRCUE_10275 [Bosea sp. (in: a-proteobacteria)]
MTKFALKLALASGVLMSASVAAVAGGDCRGSACYKLVVTPPAYQTVSEQVMVRPSQRIARHIPAEYGTVSETVTVRHAQTIARHIPAVYGTTAETVMVAPAGKVWQISYDAHGNKVGCWVSTPARYATQHRRVVVREAQTVHHTIPAVHAQRHRQVVVRHAAVEYDTIPAAYQTNHRHVMVHPGSKAWAPVRGY